MPHGQGTFTWDSGNRYTGAWASGQKQGHGAFTWAAWFFRHFVRDTAMLTSQDAIRRITSLPATRLGLSDRGVLRPGACADIAIFDPQNFAERGTTFEPNQVATGMTHVIVNGIVALEDGQLTGNRGGRVLRS